MVPLVHQVAQDPQVQLVTQEVQVFQVEMVSLELLVFKEEMEGMAGQEELDQLVLLVDLV